MNRLTDPHTTLAEKLGITEADLHERKALLDIGPEQVAELISLRPAVAMIVDDVIEEFYDRQLSVPAIRAMIGDTDTLLHLKRAFKPYVLELFSGDYGMDYVQRRLRAGRVHGRIGVPPKFYVSAIYLLIKILGERLEPNTGSPYPPPSLRRLLLLDLELTIDTYMHGLVAQVAAGNEALALHSRQLETLVNERTEQIQAMSRIDTLTGLGNRAALIETLDAACRLAGLDGVQHCLLFIDLDGFKAVNDDRGHVAGDDLLRSIGQILRRSCRSEDRVFRYGGDEFCILMPGIGAEGASQLRLRLDVLIREATDGQLGISAGWAVIAPHAAAEPDKVLREADKAMYADKKARAARRAQALPQPLAKDRAAVSPPPKGTPADPGKDDTV